MKSSRVFACLVALVAGGLAQRSYAAGVTVFAQAYEASEGIGPGQIGRNSGEIRAATFAEFALGGTTAIAISEGTRNKLGASIKVVASRPDLNSILGAVTEATWEDGISFLDEEDERVNPLAGSVLVTATIDGTISLAGEGAGARATLNLIVGSTPSQVSFTEAGSHEYKLEIEVEAPLDIDGDFYHPITLQLLLGGGNSSFEPSTTDADFSTTARITNIVYLTPEGLPDPSITVISESGVVYGVPEPSCGALAVVCLCMAGGRFRRR